MSDTDRLAPKMTGLTVSQLGIDSRVIAWRRSGEGESFIEVAFAGEEWVLMRVTGDPGSGILVFDRREWECFIDGAKDGEFDDAAR